MPGFFPEKLLDAAPHIASPQEQPSPVMPDLGRDVNLPAPETPHKSEKELILDENQHILQPQNESVKIGRKKAQAQQTQAPTKTLEREEIEKVLAEGVIDIYQMLTPKEQEQFRRAGEEAVSKIEILVKEFRATARTVLHLIRQWLMTIPRINTYFLEQESKIKTDRILKMQQKLKVQNHKTHL